MTWPSGSGNMVHDLIAKGLAELGHEVFYHLPEGVEEPLPEGVELINGSIPKVDVLHALTFRNISDLIRKLPSRTPLVKTCHLDPTVPGRVIPGEIGENWIFVSRTLAQSLGRTRWVLNGIDPEEFRYREVKAAYFVFIASMEWADHKGLDIALRLRQEMGFPLVVAGSAKSRPVIDAIAARCEKAGAGFIGDVRGSEKAALLANARGLLFPTQINEAFGLSIVEAFMSGTPVISSINGACPELVTADTGFLCRTDEDYRDAVCRVDSIRPLNCRRLALEKYHYLTMASGYVREYERELA